MAIMVTVECGDCGYVGRYGSEAKAAAFFPKHSCRKYVAEVEHAARVAAARAVERPVRDCGHKRARHVHGTPQAYILDLCRCLPCTDANTAREKRRALAKVSGGYDAGRVDAAPVREHILFLRQAGYGLKMVARLAGVSNATLGKILYGDPTRNMPPRARVEKRVAAKVLAVRPSLSTLGETVPVKSADTAARVRHLVCMGYSIGWLSQRAGLMNNTLFRLLERDVCHAKTARAVRELFLQFGDKPRLASTRFEQAAITRAVMYAAARGWEIIQLPGQAATPADAVALATVTEAPVEPTSGLDWFMRQRQERMHTARPSAGVHRPGIDHQQTTRYHDVKEKP